MTRPSDERSPFSLFDDVDEPSQVASVFEKVIDVLAADVEVLEEGSGKKAAPEPVDPRVLAQIVYDHIPADDRAYKVLVEGPLLPFDYCWLRGQRQGLLPVAQSQLVRRNPRLCMVDRTPLGIDPNADLFRCFLMHGNPNEPVTVYTFYERHVCSGVIEHYFQLPEIQRSTQNHFERTNWLASRAIGKPATAWLAAYDKALDVMFDKLRERDVRERAALASEYAQWLLPMMRRGDLLDGIRTPQQESNVIQVESVEQLPTHRRILWDWIGDFMFLSILSNTAFCSFARMKQMQFPNLVREDAEAGQVRAMGMFQPQYMTISLIVLFVGLLIVGNASGQTGLEPGPFVVGGLPALAAGFVLLLNLVYWLLFTSHNTNLARLVPQRWLRRKPKNLGYLR